VKGLAVSADELREAKRQAEAEVLAVLRKFEESTGLTVESVYLSGVFYAVGGARLAGGVEIRAELK
jgi:hypothetical protein